MEKGSMKFIGNYLERNRAIKPIPTDVEAGLTQFRDVRAVIFDIYGTLLVSASGDVNETELSMEHALESFRTTGIRIKKRYGDIAGRLIVSEYRRQINKHTIRRSAEGERFPEVDVREVWKSVISELKKKGIIQDKVDPDFEILAFIFETLSNPVSPMPGMMRLLETLKKRNIVMGTVSNAQFYTPITMNYFISGRLEKSSRIGSPFARDLQVFSYEHLTAKPSGTLFEKMTESLAAYDIRPNNAVYAGNDMYKDIRPASEQGFKTALFAGDKRSFRTGGTDASDYEIKPYCIITSLEQIPFLFS
jgi:putative hydrolase of the HAD superfamily